MKIQLQNNEPFEISGAVNGVEKTVNVLDISNSASEVAKPKYIELTSEYDEEILGLVYTAALDGKVMDYESISALNNSGELSYVLWSNFKYIPTYLNRDGEDIQFICIDNDLEMKLYLSPKNTWNFAMSILLIEKYITIHNPNIIDSSFVIEDDLYDNEGNIVNSIADYDTIYISNTFFLGFKPITYTTKYTKCETSTFILYESKDSILRYTGDTIGTNGTWYILPKLYLPDVTSDDAGRVLLVSEYGTWDKVLPTTLYSGGTVPDNTTGNDGDIYVQT